MAFETFADFLNMAGHGSYVWTAYLISVLILLLLVVIPIRQYRKQLVQIGQRELAAQSNSKQ